MWHPSCLLFVTHVWREDLATSGTPVQTLVRFGDLFLIMGSQLVFIHDPDPEEWAPVEPVQWVPNQVPVMVDGKILFTRPP